MSFPQPLAGLSYCLLGNNPLLFKFFWASPESCELREEWTLSDTAPSVVELVDCSSLLECIRASPKIASLASFTASTPILHSVSSVGYFFNTPWMDKSWSVLISDDGISVNLLLTMGIGCGCWIVSEWMGSTPVIVGGNGLD